MAGQKREARFRARCPGHPRLSLPLDRQNVDARHTAGHDEHGRIAIETLPPLQQARFKPVELP